MKKLFLLFLAVFAIGMCASAQTRTVRGIVLDVDHDEPLPGVTVSAGPNVATVTDIDGVFTIKAPASVKKLKFSMIGFQTIEMAIPAKGEMLVKMSSATTELDDVIVTAYGTPKKAGNVVGAVSVVGSALLENVPTPNFVDALQGQVAGLSIMSGSGDPSTMKNEVHLRGVNSLNASNTPLYILDGAPVSENVFITLNPADIESVAVLKDAASLAIYGSRAANGVIVITSKKGAKAQKPKFTIRATYGWSNMASDKIDMMDSKQYIKYRDLIGQPVTDDIKNLVNKYGISTNWADEMFETANTYSLDAALQGGSEYVNYYLSFNHMDQGGIICKSGMRRETIRTSLETKVTDWFRVGFQGNLGYTKYETNNQVTYGDGVYSANPFVFARKALPYDSPYYYTIDEATGKITYGERAEYLRYTHGLTPQYYANKWMAGDRNRVTFTGAFFEQITPVKGLTIRAQQALDSYEQRNNILYKPVMEPLVTPMGDSYPTDQDLGSGRNSQGFTRYYQFTYTNTAEYELKLRDVHNISFLLGEESIIAKSSGFGVYTEGQTDVRQMLLTQGTSIKIANVSQSITEQSQNSFFVNGSYNYDFRYFLDLSFRTDGSSKFAPGHRWANFYSVGLMWNAKNELFLEPATWLDDLRIRFSHGTTGNSAIGNYGYFGLVGSYTTPYNGSPAIGVTQPSNYDLTWETVRSTDVGISFGIFKKLKGEVDFYHKKTTDMLMDIPY
ncbi:MAG: SusC/RagA family TonB-linked outer membrane protein, partial [Muribaculaceae bacterium]|nr:SusC/RagA family TonB-linked outer membrane protein [Muribaculaceae bacterium]